METKQESLRKLLQTAAYVAILAWGIRAAAYPISVVLIALLLAYSALPLPQWLIHRFRLRRGGAVSWTLAFLFAAYCLFAMAVVHIGMRMKNNLPIYQQRAGSLLGSSADYLVAMATPLRRHHSRPSSGQPRQRKQYSRLFRQVSGSYPT